MKSTTTQLAIVFTLALAASQLRAATQYRLEQSDGQGGWNTVGEFSAFSAGDYSMAQLYNYKGQSGYDFWGLPSVDSLPDNEDLVGPDSSHLFLANTSDGLGLFVIHGKGSGSTTGVKRTAEMVFAFDPAGQISIAVQDDSESRPDDDYDVVTVDSGDVVTVDSDDQVEEVKGQWKWDSGWTDGIGILWPGIHGRQARLEFTNLDDLNPNDGEDTDYSPFSGLDGLALLAPDATDGSQILEDGLDQGDTPAAIRLTVLPLPPAAWPAVAMLGVLALRRLRSRRLNESEELR